MKPKGCRSFLYALSLVMLSLSVCQSTFATVVTTEYGDEQTILALLFKQTDNTICIRCSRLDDAVLLRSLEKASNRGVKVRVIVDTITPGLSRVLVHRPLGFSVCQTSISDKGHFYSLQNESYALMDTTVAWYGVKSWSSKSWVRKSLMILDSKSRSSYEDMKVFNWLWQRSKIV